MFGILEWDEQARSGPDDFEAGLADLKLALVIYYTLWNLSTRTESKNVSVSGSALVRIILGLDNLLYHDTDPGSEK